MMGMPMQQQGPGVETRCTLGATAPISGAFFMPENINGGLVRGSLAACRRPNWPDFHPCIQSVASVVENGTAVSSLS